jgi:predicted HTH domain antitoxin
MHIEMDIPESAFSALRLSPPQFARELRLAAALKWFEAGMISQSKAAALAGVSREEFLLGCGRFQVSAVQTTTAELAEELARD